MQLILDPRSDAVEAVHAATALYTVTPIVDSLLDRIGWPLAEGRLLDPCAGDGSFILRALMRLETLPGDFEAVGRVSGWEMHPLAVISARESVEELLKSRGWSESDAGSASRTMINEGDFLTDAKIGVGEFSIIAGNPPYLRYGHLPEYFKQIYDEKIVAHARGDMLHAFLNHCVTLLPEHGLLCFVTADRWMFNSSAAKLRESLGRHVGLTHVARLDPDTSFYRPKYRRRGSPPRIHPVEVVLSPASRFLQPITAQAISPDEGVSHDRTPGKTLEDVATIRIAPWLGPSGIFVINSTSTGGLPAECLIPAVDTDDIDPQADRLNTPTRFAILTRRGEEPSGALQQHLLQQRHRLPKKCEGKPYWMPPETITLDLSAPSILIPRIARKLRVIPLPAGVLPISHNMQVIASKDGAVTLDRISEILAHPESQSWIARHAPRLENGFLSITTSLLRRLPLPVEFQE